MESDEKSNSKKEFLSNSSSPLPMNITVLVVDDDYTSLAIVAAMLREWQYEVATAETPMDALATLRARPGDIDLIVTDLHMPGMNGMELQQQIKREFKQLPVIMMSSDDQESVMLRCLAGGAVFFMVKPINPEDLKDVWQYAIAAKKGKAAVVVDEETGSTEQGKSSSSAGKLSRNRKNDVEKNDSAKRGKKRKASMGEDDEEDETASAPKKAKVVWTSTLHNQFLEALRHIGMEKAVPKKILKHMNVPGLTRENVASHLQKYRMFLKRVAERGCFSSKDFVERVFKSSFASGHPTLLKTAQKYSRMAELQLMRGLTFHPRHGGTTVPVHLNTASYRSVLFLNHNNIASSSNSACQHHGYGHSRLLGNQAANNYRRSISGNSNPLYEGNHLGFANGSNLSSLNGGFSGGVTNARNGLMTGANAMQTYQHQFQARPNFCNDAGASSSQFRFGSYGFHSSNSNLGTGNIGTISTSYPTLNSSCINSNSYPGTSYRLPADEPLLGIGQTSLANGGYGSMNGPFNENVNVAAMGNQAFYHMAQGAGSSSQVSYGPNQVSPTYTAANQQANTSTLPGLSNNGGASHYDSVHLMSNGGATHYNTVHMMNDACTVDNIAPLQQLSDGCPSDILLESRNHKFSNQQQAGADRIQTPDLPCSLLFSEIYPSLEDLLNAEFLESLSLEDRKEQAPAQIQSVNEEVIEMDTIVDGGALPSDAYHSTTNFDQSTSQQQSGEQLADSSELCNICGVNDASATESGNEPSNNQNWGDDFVNSLLSFDPRFE